MDQISKNTSAEKMGKSEPVDEQAENSTSKVSVKTRAAGKKSKANSSPELDNETTPENATKPARTMESPDEEKPQFQPFKDEIANSGSNSCDNTDNNLTATSKMLTDTADDDEDDLTTNENEFDESIASPDDDAGVKDLSPVLPGVALNGGGQEQTLRNFIFAAIGVMKNRKARPDTKRICNWIHRRYGNPVQAVSDELERLVQVGELSRVDYKGSASFRIVNPNGKVKRKRRTIKLMDKITPKAVNNSSPAVVGFINEASPVETPTLRTLVLDLLAESGVTMIKPTTTITLTFIERAIQGTNRNIPKATMLEDLHKILSREVERGNFTKIVDDTYWLPPDGEPYEPPLSQVTMTNGAVNPMQQMIIPASTLSSPATPGASFQQPFSLIQNQGFGVFDQGAVTPPPLTVQSSGINSSTTSTPSLSMIESIKQPIMQPPPPPMSPMAIPVSTVRTPGLPPMTSLTPPPGVSKAMPLTNDNTLTITGIASKSDEERKNDLINEKLFKLTSSLPGSKNRMSPIKGKTSGEFHLTLKENLRAGKTKKTKALAMQRQKEIKQFMAMSEIKTEPQEEQPAEVRFNRANSKDSISSHDSLNDCLMADDSDDKPLVGMKRKKKAKSEESSGTPEPPAVTGARGGRKKISRKIFDPADHEQPSRKRKASSPTPGGTDVIKLESGAEPPLIKAEATCVLCLKPFVGGLSSPKKGIRPDTMLRCSVCTNSVHPACMEYNDELTKKVMSMPWQCTSCKTCHICKQANDDDCMLICDSCDLGFHMDCHRPPLSKPPQTDKWECYKCSPQPPPPPPPKSRTVSRSNETTPSPLRVTHQISGQENITNGYHIKREAIKKDSTSKFLPILPPHMHPHTGILPNNWEDYEPDPSIPDVSSWSSLQIHDYFVRSGFSQDICQTILDQEIDGGSLLLLHRNDVLTSLGLKLGPALKVFNHVKKLQTRRHFPNQ